MSDQHDYVAQRRETFAVFKGAKGLPATAVIEFVFFVEETDADWDGFERALRAEGFKTRRLDDGETVLALCGPMPVQPEPVWTAEELATRIALRFDFYPDGWSIAE